MKPALEIVPALVVMAARAFIHPPPILLLDPVFVLAALWILLAASRDPRLSRGAVVAVSVVLFAAYAWRQLPLALDLLQKTF